MQGIDRVASNLQGTKLTRSVEHSNTEWWAKCEAVPSSFKGIAEWLNDCRRRHGKLLPDVY